MWWFNVHDMSVGCAYKVCFRGVLHGFFCSDVVVVAWVVCWYYSGIVMG